MDKKKIAWLVATGLAIGAFAVLLTAEGNPKNMGMCAACFLRDTAGALGLDGATTVQYLRPEIIGFLLGSFILAAFSKRFSSTGGSAPLARFAIAFFVMIGALVFLGCSLRVMLRLAAGDLNALIGLLGFAVGVGIGAFFIKKGFSLGEAKEQSKTNGFVIPVLAAILLIFAIVEPSFVKASTSGPASQHAPLILSLVLALIVGALGQKSGLCTSGAIRDLILIRNPALFFGYVSILIAAFVGVLILGDFKLGFEGQPIAHSETVWNFLGLTLVGYGSVLLGGCPFRQLIMSGEGNSDAGIVVLAFLVAAATAHNFGISASPNGVPLNGQITIGVGFVVLTLIAVFGLKRRSGGKTA
jgi:YedE family putative selenium metabolism protein